MPILSPEDVLKALAQPATDDFHPFMGSQIPSCHFPKKFNDLADFDGAEFVGPAKFTGAFFSRGVSFINTVFREEVDFTEAVFDGPAFFWKCTFEKSAKFTKCTVRAPLIPTSRRLPGEANFSYSTFKENADFTRGRFHGEVIFHRTYFYNEANFQEARFDAWVRFEGSEGDVCLSRNEIGDMSLIGRMSQSALVIPNIDHSGFYNLNSRIDKLESLHDYMNKPDFRRLRLPGTELSIVRTHKSVPRDEFFKREKTDIAFSQDEIERVVSLWKRYRRKMFSTSKSAIFIRTTFTAGALFSEVNLDHAKFQQTPLANVVFSAVTWSKLPTTFHLLLRGERNALYDEVEQVKLPFLERTYHDLRLGYQSRGMIDVARDFYYGELELRYRAHPFFRRKASLAFFYRYFSGFGRQQGLAGLWLVLMVFLLFPLTLVAAHWFSPVLNHVFSFRARLEQIPRVRPWWTSFARAMWLGILHSLEACTFISRETAPHSAVYSDLERFVAGLERIVVAAQLGLFLLATKWQFERNPGSS